MSTVEQAIDDITLLSVEHAEVSIDRIITEDGPRAHIDFAIVLVRAFYNKWIKTIEGYGDKAIPAAMRERCLLYAKVDAHQWLFTQGHELVDRATAFLMDEANRTGWFREDYFSWDRLEDMVASMVDQTTEGSGPWWQWLTFQNKIIPAARANGIEPGKLYSSAMQIRKARQLAPAWNELEARMKGGVITEEEGAETLRWMLGLAANRDVNSTQMETQVNEWRGKVAEIPAPIRGMLVLLPKLNKRIFVIETDNPVIEKLITNALRNKVELDAVGLKTLLQLATEWIGIERMGKVYDSTDNGGHCPTNGRDLSEDQAS